MATVPLLPTDDPFAIPRRADSAPAPLSFAQELLWLMDRASPGLTAWNVPRGFRLRGTIDPAALQHALDAVVARHEVLRTVFVAGVNGPVQRVMEPSPVPLTYVDLSGVPDDDRAGRLELAMRAEARRPFDLERDMLLRAVLVALSPTDHVLAITSHHIVSDGWSKGVLLRELSACYAAARRGVAATLPALPIQFADYAAWERDTLHEAALAEPLAYWRTQLAGPLPSLELPVDLLRPQVPGFDGAWRAMVLPSSLVERMEALARDHDVTLYMVLLAGYITLLHRCTGQEDIVVGSPMAARMQSETEGLIGYFANTLVLRTLLDGDPTFVELLARVRETVFGAFENQQVPFERLVLELQRERQLTHAPLFQAVLTMEDTIPAALELAGAEVEPLTTELESTKFDLTLLVARQPDGLRLTLWYRKDLHVAATADRMLRHLRAIFDAAVARPAQPIGDIDLLDGRERDEILAASTGATMPPPALVREQIAAVIARAPDAVAVVSGERSLTYGELDRAATLLAHRLRALGVAHGSRVGLYLDRSVDAVTAMLGIMRAGATYIPLAVDVPISRVARQIDEASIPFVVTTNALGGALPDGITPLCIDATADPAVDASPHPPNRDDDVAYILFTSGSTGVPKGVAVTHRNLAHYTGAIVARLGAPAPRSFASVSTLAADLGNTAIFPALVTGGTLHLIGADVANDAARFGDYMVSRSVDLLKITPNHLRALLGGPHGNTVLPSAWLVLGGEACSWDLADDVLRAGSCRLLNHYGPTEATVGCCTFEVTVDSARAARAAGAQTVPIGRPLANCRAYVVDRRGHLAAPGVTGELWIGGAGVASGYVDRADLTAERFVAATFEQRHDTHAYRTGDRVRRLATGDLEFLGRVDDQVKIRGYRVEPGEIEQALAAHAGVAQAAVIARTGSTGTQLIGYVVPKTAGYAAAHAERATAERLLAFLVERLPEYMVPAAIVLLDAMPLSANGKIDRTALAAVDVADTAEEYVAPSTPTEVIVVQIWTDVLKRDRIGVGDNFLTLGGHSLMAIRVLGRISKQLGVRLPLRTLFEAPTVAQLARVIDAELLANETELLRALAAVEQMSDADVARQLANDGPSDGAR